MLTAVSLDPCYSRDSVLCIYFGHSNTCSTILYNKAKQYKESICTSQESTIKQVDELLCILIVCIITDNLVADFVYSKFMLTLLW